MFKKLLLALLLTGCEMPIESDCKTELPRLHYTVVEDYCGWGWTIENHPKLSGLPCLYGASGTTSNSCDQSTTKFCSDGISVAQYIGGLSKEDEKVYIYTTFRDREKGCHVYVVQEEK